MPVSDEYLAYVLDRLACVGGVRARKMFGGAGIYRDDVFFALVAQDVLYLKVDDTNRSDYEEAGSSPFRPYRDKPHVMSYYEVPIDVLEDDLLLREWALKALAAARAATADRSTRSRR